MSRLPAHPSHLRPNEPLSAVEHSLAMTSPDTHTTTDSPWLAAPEPADEAVTMPQTLAGVFDEAFDLYKRHFSLLAMIVAVGLIPTEIIRNTVIAVWLHPLDAHLSGAGNVNTDSLFMLRIGQFIFGEPHIGFPGLLAFVVLILLSAPISVAVSDLYFGRATTVKECYLRSRPYFMNMVWGYCLLFLVVIGVAFAGVSLVSIPAALLTGFMAAAGVPEIAAVVLAVLFCLPYFFCVGVVARNFVFMTPLTVLEGLPASFVAYRNIQLVGKKRFWRTWAAASALPILWIGLQWIFDLSRESAIHAMHLPSVVDFTVTAAFGAATSFFLAPYWTIFLTLLYYDYRVRREGFDVRVLSLTDPERRSEQGGGS